MRTSAALVVLVAALSPGAARAVKVDTGSELQLRFDSTLRYTAAARISGRSAALLASINADDGNRNFDPGLISQRLDLLSELDLTYRGGGARVSGAAWFDLLYNLPNDNDVAATVNSVSVPPGDFTRATRNLHGRKAEPLDAFLFADGLFGLPLTVRAGWHTLLWGESLLLADNGISYAQAPLDAIKALSVPGSQAKELFMPVGQISAQLRPISGLTLAGYYQLFWRRTRLPAAGSYFSSADILDAGGERLLLPPPAPAGAGLFRGQDLEGSDSGQWGISARYSVPILDGELGVYFIRYNEKFPQIYLQPGANPDPSVGKVGEYFLVYPEDIKLFGGSFATGIGALAVAGEVHGRFDTPLASTPQTVMPGVPADNDDNPLYAVGNTIHAQVSAIYFLRPSSLWQSATLLGEAGWQGYTSITRNPQAFDPTRKRQAFGLRAIFSPSYFQVLPNLDLTAPLSLSYNPEGRSPIAIFNGPAHKGGVVSAGITAEYEKIWVAGLQVSFFFGPAPFQARQDRHFASLAVQRTF